MDGDDDFLDGVDFDAIPAGTLLQLEQTAWQATQAALQQTGEPLHNTVAVGNEYSLNKNRPHRNAPAQRRESSFYGDVEVIDLDADILEDNNEGEDSADVVNSNPPVSQNILQGHGPDQRLNVPVQAHQPEQDSEINYVSRDIGARIEEFSRQYDAVSEQLASAREDATKKAGEVAILRANLNKQAQEFERTIASLRAQLAEVTTKSKGAQQAAIDDRQKLETENLFLREELRDETLRVNNLRAKNRTEPPQTPRKQRTLPFRDGFDDDEIGFASPTKSSGGRSKRGTPSGHGKRKRKVSDASIHMPPLQLSQSNQPLTQGDHALAGLDTLEIRDYNSGGSIEEGIYITQVLNHKSDPHGESDLEIMAGLAFPSEPKRKISSIVLETMSGVTSNYPVKYAHCLIQLWDRALVEKFYRIVPVFMASIKFILLLDLYSIGPQLIAELAGILQASIYVNAATRFEHSAVSSKVKGESRRTPRAALHPDVDSTAALEILYLLALACRQDDNFHEQLWRNVHFDILLMTLNDHQPLQGIVLSLKILSTSLRRGSFGTIHASETEQREVENHFIERVTCLLFQRIEPDEGDPDYLPLQICYMRLEALTFLEMITYHGLNTTTTTTADASKSTIVSYPLVLPRLFRTLYDEMDRLYMRRPEHDLRTALINRLMHLIYKLIRSGGGKTLHEGLSRLSGAKQKHRLVLSRLAFSEGQFLEAGITEETMEMARRLLEEEDMSPEEAEALFDAFPTGGRLSSREGTQNEQ